MFKHSSGLAVALGILAAGQGAVAQDDLSEIRKELTRIGAQLDVFQERLDKLSTAPAPTPQAELTPRVEALEKAAVQLQQDVEGVAQTVALIETNLDNLDVIVKEQVGRPSRNGSYVPNVLGNMNRDGDFRGEMMGVGKRISQGRLVFDNRTLSERVVYVNGSPWRVRTGISHIVVPRGRVIVSPPFGAEQVYEFADGDDALRLTVSDSAATIVSRPVIISPWPTVVTAIE